MSGRGRPKGTKNGYRKTQRQQIQVWKPIHETIITLHVLGIKNNDIAKQLQLSPMTVSNITKSNKGQERIIELTKIHNDSIKESIKGKIDTIRESSINNIHNVVTNKDGTFDNRPLALFEASIKAIKVVEDLEAPSKNINPQLPNGQVSNNQFNFFTTPENAKRIIDGLSKLKEIANLSTKNASA